MIKLIIRRFIELLISTFLIATATFFLISAVPGDALSAQTDKLPEATREQVYKNTGLDKPVLERYAITMNNMVHGQFGESISDPSVTMSSLIRDQLPASARLGIQQMLLGIPLGLLLGILAAVYKNTWIDRVITILALFLMSFPVWCWACFCRVILAENLAGFRLLAGQAVIRLGGVAGFIRSCQPLLVALATLRVMRVY